MKSAGVKQVAERYVKALLDVSGDVRGNVEKDMTTLQTILEASRELQNLLSNPLLTRKEQGAAMHAVLSAIKAQTITKDFVALLARQKRLTILPQAIALFLEKASAGRGGMRAEAVSALKLTAKDADAISEILNKIFGSKIMLKTRDNPELLGGVIIKIGSLQLDASLSGKLRRLGNKLRAA